jgi:hypothetical protein
MSVSIADTYIGDWQYQQALQLLSRTTFGVTPAQINIAVQVGLEKTIDLLFSKPTTSTTPLNSEYTKDTYVPIGKTWIYAYYQKDDVNIIYYRMKSLRAWVFDSIINENISITEQLTLFWQNHFGISHIEEQKVAYRFNMLVREFAFGNFKELIKRVSIDPAILEFLNNNDNKKGSPNENYAREMLELFTVGKGALAATGDYTTFSEQDVREIAKSLTGWDAKGFYTMNAEDNDKDVIESYFIEERHDKTNKQLSHRFGNEQIENKGNEEYKQLIDILFKQENVALNLCRRIYRWFINSKIDAAIEKDVIATLLVFGRNIKNTIVGENPKIDTKVELQAGVEMKIDFRDVYGSVLVNWFGLQITDAKNILQKDISLLPIL